MIGDQTVGVNEHAEEPRLGGSVVVAARVGEVEGERFTKERVQVDLRADQCPVGGVKGGHIVDDFVDYLCLAQVPDTQALVGRLKDEAVGIKSIDAVQALEIVQQLAWPGTHVGCMRGIPVGGGSMDGGSVALLEYGSHKHLQFAVRMRLQRNLRMYCPGRSQMPTCEGSNGRAAGPG